MSSFRLSTVYENRDFPGGIEALIRSDSQLLVPPRWADSTDIVDSKSSHPDGLLLITNGRLSSELRKTFFRCYRQGIPIAAICYGEKPDDDPILRMLFQQELCWTFGSASEGRELLRDQIQEWLSGLNREFFSFPEGEELLESYGDVLSDPVDTESLEKARDVFSRRGFVCLSGSLGAGKTSIARRLMIEGFEDGLNPVEVIGRDLFYQEVVGLLTGPEDCCVFLDLDTLRRLVDIYPIRLWSTILSLMIRATESRHRLILATSFPLLAKVFDTHGDAHITLPEPTSDRQWRLDEGQKALEHFRSLELMRKAELILLAAFDPVIDEAVFKRTLFRVWERLMVQEQSRFPMPDELEELYSASLAASGTEPFRRITGSGEAYIAISDSVMMWAIDTGVNELIREDAPVIRAFSDTLLGSDQPGVRRAGYFLACFYTELSAEERAKLLLNLSSEESENVLIDVLNTLLSRPDYIDEAVVSLCRSMMKNENSEVRGSVAGSLGMPWILNSPRFADLISMASADPDPRTRGQFLQGIALWGNPIEDSDIYFDMLDDPAPAVRQSVLFNIGSRFPGLMKKEYEVLNSVLEEGDSALLATLIIGLLDRRLEEFNQEFSDLLWVLMDRLPDGGKGRLAWRIGARLKFFSKEVRETLRSELSEDDVLLVTRCMLMSYSSIDEDEKEALWNLIHDRIAASRPFSSMVLRYYSIMEGKVRSDLLRTVLESERYDGREALSQLICRGRSDLARDSVDIISFILSKEEFRKRALLPFFVVWNRHDLGGGSEDFISMLQNDSSPMVRKALVRAISLLGDDEADMVEVLSSIAGDRKRAVRAAAASALGEFYRPGSGQLGETVSELLSDTNPYVRLSILTGLLRNTGLTPDDLLPVVLTAMDDQAPEVRLEAIRGLTMNRGLENGEGVDLKLSQRFVDTDRKVRMAAIQTVSEIPGLLSSEHVRSRMPDILLDRLSTGNPIAEELNMARKIQMDLLPENPPHPERYDIDIFYRPAREVGGDYYDFFTLPDRNLGVAIADVAGKGIPAALTMAGLKGNLEAYVKSIYSISEIMQKVNETSVLGEGDPIMTGLFYGVMELDSGRMTYVNAGHNPPLLVRREGSYKLLERGGLILGLSEDVEYEHGTEKLDPGDVLVLYTDGLTEAMSSSSEEFGAARMRDIVIENRDLSARQITTSILDAVNLHSRNAPQSDDQTLVILKHS